LFVTLKENFIEEIVKNMSVPERDVNPHAFSKWLSLKATIRAAMGRLVWFKKQTPTSGKPNISYNVLAFRVYIICAMFRLLQDDASHLS
jgi:hypothetical protein